MNPFFQIVGRSGLLSDAGGSPCLSALLLLSLALTAFASPVSAQTETGASSSLVREIERLRRDLSDIQRYIYREYDTVAPPARSQNVEPGGAARLQRQILEMQGQIREVTGHIERVQHDIRLMGERLDKLVADVDIRLQALEGGQPLAGAGQSAAEGRWALAATPRQEAGTTVISSGGVTGVQTELAAGQRSLGQISGRELAAVREGQPVPPAAATQPVARVARAPEPASPPPPQAAPAPGGVSSSVVSVARPLSTGELPEGTARQQYEYAFGKLKTRNYDDAENALRAFVDRHPDDPLAGNAMYWMGETYYVRKQFSEAARIFLDAYQRFPKGNKAPDNLFKLAKSLSQIGEDKSACTTYAELVKTFPSANQRILNGARSDMTRLGCG